MGPLGDGNRVEMNAMKSRRAAKLSTSMTEAEFDNGYWYANDGSRPRSRDWPHASQRVDQFSGCGWVKPSAFIRSNRLRRAHEPTPIQKHHPWIAKYCPDPRAILKFFPVPHSATAAAHRASCQRLTMPMTAIAWAGNGCRFNCFSAGPTGSSGLCKAGNRVSTSSPSDGPYVRRYVAISVM